MTLNVVNILYTTKGTMNEIRILFFLVTLDILHQDTVKLKKKKVILTQENETDIVDSEQIGGTFLKSCSEEALIYHIYFLNEIQK